MRSTVPVVRSALMRGASCPSKRADGPACLFPKQTSDTRTAAPSMTQGSSDQASKIAP